MRFTLDICAIRCGRRRAAEYFTSIGFPRHENYLRNTRVDLSGVGSRDAMRADSLAGTTQAVPRHVAGALLIKGVIARTTR